MRSIVPRSLAARVALILCSGLVVAHGLAFGLMLLAQGDTAVTMMLGYLPKDVATSIAILERVPAAERQAWLSKIGRRNYAYALQPPGLGAAVVTARGRAVAAAIAAELGPQYRVTASVPNGTDEAARLSLGLTLHDGTPVTITLAPPPLGLPPWLVAILAGQLLAIAGLTWLAVRLATRPLAHLARAADALATDFARPPLAEHGPDEVAHAARALNALQRQIHDQLAERVQILAAVSHDLQTPIARMALRADLLEDPTLRDRLRADLRTMQHLVEQGIAYARTAHAATEPVCRVDLSALLESLAADYTDAGRVVRVAARSVAPVATRPETLRRVVTNLLDNALKFGDDVTVTIEAPTPETVTIVVGDRGPGIPDAELAAVLQPFRRIDGSRSRDTGGSGLGLAIADRLTRVLGGTLVLANRSGGGLSARVTLSRSSLPLAGSADTRERPSSPHSQTT